MMAVSPWRRLFGLDPPADDAGRHREDAQRKQLRHDYDGRLNAVTLATEEARRMMDEIDVQVDYLRAARKRKDDAEPKGDGPGGGLRGGDAGDA